MDSATAAVLLLVAIPAGAVLLLFHSLLQNELEPAGAGVLEAAAFCGLAGHENKPKVIH